MAKKRKSHMAIEHFRKTADLMCVEGDEAYAAKQLNIKQASETEKAFLAVCQMAYREPIGPGELFVRSVIETYARTPLTPHSVREICKDFMDVFEEVRNQSRTFIRQYAESCPASQTDLH